MSTEHTDWVGYANGIRIHKKKRLPSGNLFFYRISKMLTLF